MPREDGREGIGRPMRASTQSIQPDGRALVTALGGRWYGTYGTAICPAHNDRQPSLSICDAKDGKVLVHCHAGCDQRDVIAALTARGLWDGKMRSTFRRAFARKVAEPQPDRQQPERREAAIAIWQSTIPAAGTPVESYLVARGLTLPVAPSLRFHRGLKHPSGGVWPDDVPAPAILARASNELA